jgi:hypothetical protein
VPGFLRLTVTGWYTAVVSKCFHGLTNFRLTIVKTARKLASHTPKGGWPHILKQSRNRRRDFLYPCANKSVFVRFRSIYCHYCVKPKITNLQPTTAYNCHFFQQLNTFLTFLRILFGNYLLVNPLMLLLHSVDAHNVNVTGRVCYLT